MLDAESGRMMLLVLLQASECCRLAVFSCVQENWCKKGPPTPDLIAKMKPQPGVPASPPKPPPQPDMDKLRQLTSLADQLGLLLQNQHQVGGRVCCTCSLAQ